MTNRIVLGHIATAHGIKGEVMVKSYTEDPADLGAYGPLADERGQRPLVIEALRVTGKGILVRFKGVNDRTAAEALRGMALTVARDALPEPEPDQFYHSDLIGMTAIAPDGATLGVIVAMQNFGAGDMLEVRFTGQRETGFVPFTDPCVPTIDLKARRLTLVLPAEVEAHPEDDDDTTDPGGKTDGDAKQS